jgi:hypothetical protein
LREHGGGRISRHRLKLEQVGPRGVGKADVVGLRTATIDRRRSSAWQCLQRQSSDGHEFRRDELELLLELLIGALPHSRGAGTRCAEALVDHLEPRGTAKLRVVAVDVKNNHHRSGEARESERQHGDREARVHLLAREPTDREAHAVSQHRRLPGG